MISPLVMTPTSWPLSPAISVAWRRLRGEDPLAIVSESAETVMDEGITGGSSSMTSATRMISKMSTLYSRAMCWPRRASFSVRIDRRRSSTVTQSAAALPTRSAGRTSRSWVSSRTNTVPVRGERIVPPIMPAIPIMAHRPGSPTPVVIPKSAPIPPPIMRRGARTPPDVPDPSATAQTTLFAITSAMSEAPSSWPSIR